MNKLPDYPALNKHGIEPTDFNLDGLRWPINHLQLVFPEIIGWPMANQAQYVDSVIFEIVTKNNPDEIELLGKHISDEQDYTYETADATSIGNLAFISMYCMDHKLALVAYALLKKLMVDMTFKSVVLAENCQSSFSPNTYKPKAEA